MPNPRLSFFYNGGPWQGDGHFAGVFFMSRMFLIKFGDEAYESLAMGTRRGAIRRLAELKTELSRLGEFGAALQVGQLETSLRRTRMPRPGFFSRLKLELENILSHKA